MCLFGGELRHDRLATAVAEQVVVLVQADRGGQDRVVADEPDEARFDQVVELVVERAGLRLRAQDAAATERGGGRSSLGYLRHARAGGDGLMDDLAVDSRGGPVGRPGPAGGRRPAGQAVAGSATGLVSASAARVASITKSMSARVTP